MPISNWEIVIDFTEIKEEGIPIADLLAYLEK